MSKPFTKEDLDACWQYSQEYLVDILNGEYDLEEAREDLRGLIGSKYDPRLEHKPKKVTGGSDGRNR
jgi:hypothetical protein